MTSRTVNTRRRTRRRRGVHTLVRDSKRASSRCYGLPTITNNSTAAVLLIDVQPEWWTPTVAKKFPAFAARVADLCATCRTRGIRLIHVRARYDTSARDKPHNRWLNQFKRLNPEKPTQLSGEATPFAQELDNELIVYKPAFDAFVGTSLYRTLRKHNIRTLYIGGLLTSVCVHHTAHGAFVRGYQVNVLKGCCADRTRQRHLAALRLYGGYMYTVV